MSIIRVKKDSNYVVMNKTVLNDKRLSWKAKGIIAYLLSMPDDWVFYIDELVTHSTDGIDSFRSGFNELKKNGYVERIAIKDETTKKFIKWETIVHEVPLKPQLENPNVGNPQLEKLYMENPTILNNDINQVINKISIYNNESECDLLLNKQSNEMIEYYDFNIQKVTQSIRKELSTLIDNYTFELSFEAVKIAALNKPNKPIKYIETILKNWRSESISNINQLRERNIVRSKSRGKTEVVPDWFYKRHEEQESDQEEGIDFERERLKILQKLNREA